MSQLGNPAPLGLLGFGMTTCFLMFVDMGWSEPEFKEMVFGYAIWYGGACQLLVGVLEVFKNNAFGATAFGSYGAFWLGWSWMYMMAKSQNPDGSPIFSGDFVHGEVAWFIFFGLLTCCFLFVALRKNACLITVFGLLALTYFLLAIGVAAGGGWKKLAGYVGFATALSAIYTALAEIANDEWKRAVLPGLHPTIEAQADIDEAIARALEESTKKDPPTQLANPAPLGLVGFGMTTALLMLVDLGWVEPAFKELVWGYAVWFGGACQLITAIFEIFKNNTFGAAAFGSYGAFWLGWAMMYMKTKESNPDGSPVFTGNFEAGEVLFFTAWGLLTTCFFAITTRKNVALMLVFGLLAATFFLLAIAKAVGGGWPKVAGTVGLLTAACAIYTAMAEIVNHEWKQSLFPGLQPLVRGINVDQRLDKSPSPSDM